MDGSAEVEAASVAADPRAADKTRPHRDSQAFGQGMGAGDFFRIDDVAKVGLGKQLGPRGAFALGLALRQA